MTTLTKSTLAGILFLSASPLQANEINMSAEVSHIISSAIEISLKEIKKTTLQSVANTLKIEAQKNTDTSAKKNKDENNG